MKRIVITLAVLMGLAGIVKCDDIPLAAGLAQAGAKLALAGKVDAAEQTLYRALAYDEHCGLAYFELAKLAEKSGDKALADTLYGRAFASKCEQCKRAPAVLLRMQSAINEYAAVLTKIEQMSDLAGVAVRERREALGIVVKERAVVPAQQDVVIGKWVKVDGTSISFAADHAIDFSADSSGGEWNMISVVEFSIKFGWGKTVKCTLVDHDTFLEGGKTKWTRSHQVK